MPTRQGTIRLFEIAGIEVFLHWSWFVVALYEIQGVAQRYSSPVWPALEYLALFLIVAIHEFGHALACRQSGGSAREIVLWPLGGVAYVKPPPRPGATLWSIAAGPLVNLALVPVLLGVDAFGRVALAGQPDARQLVHALVWMNGVLLVFNLLPIYPLDGGQILRSLLWFVLGRARSLAVAASVGMVGVLGLVLLAVRIESPWMGLVAAFAGLNCWRGLQQARALSRLAKLPRRPGFACPSCQAPPLLGPLWRCHHCGTHFDTFETLGRCPTCGAGFEATNCPECGTQHPIALWAERPVPPIG